MYINRSWEAHSRAWLYSSYITRHNYNAIYLGLIIELELLPIILFYFLCFISLQGEDYWMIVHQQKYETECSREKI